MTSVKQFIERNWNFVKLPDLFYNDEGYFIMRLHSFQEKEAVLSKGPYTILNMPMLIRDWSPDFNLKRDILKTIPIRVTLPHLPLYLWGARSLGRIGSILGTQIVTDECTAQRLRVSYARILIEVDITQELPTEIVIKDTEGNKMTQVLEYEWKPKFCGKCKKFGHICDKPLVKKEKVWKPKFPPNLNSIDAAESSNKGVTTTKDDDTDWTKVQRSGKKQ
ncbi:uncharacterized protein LOC131604938 [Vicia villosa]|uniref:uncharacterized protein LOC131604938 n=1 Tax=Vicia villosa TaxID=3911 RepID=UPI00273C5F50|nr:uncharacterized protein LOC131604938 [Vicia villosa]